MVLSLSPHNVHLLFYCIIYPYFDMIGSYGVVLCGDQVRLSFSLTLPRPYFLVWAVVYLSYRVFSMPALASSLSVRTVRYQVSLGLYSVFELILSMLWSVSCRSFLTIPSSSSLSSKRFGTILNVLSIIWYNVTCTFYSLFQLSSKMHVFLFLFAFFHYR